MRPKMMSFAALFAAIMSTATCASMLPSRLCGSKDQLAFRYVMDPVWTLTVLRARHEATVGGERHPIVTFTLQDAPQMCAGRGKERARAPLVAHGPA